MKQGTVITKVIMLIFLAAVLVYLGYSVVSAVYDPLTTVTAVACTAGERLDAVLWLVREERALVSDAPVTSLTLAEGAKTAAGGEVARGYRNQETYARQQDLQEMQARLAQLEYSYEEGGSVRLDASTVADLDDRIDQGITALDRSSLPQRPLRRRRSGRLAADAGAPPERVRGRPLPVGEQHRRAEG